MSSDDFEQGHQRATLDSVLAAVQELKPLIVDNALTKESVAGLKGAVVGIHTRLEVIEKRHNKALGIAAGIGALFSTAGAWAAKVLGVHIGGSP